MFIQRNTKRVGNKIYHSVLLREGYRENGKIRMRTLLNLSSWPEEKIEGLRGVLAGERVLSVEEIELGSGRSFGCLWTLKAIADRLGISAALGQSRRSKLALTMVFARIINQGSKLAAVSWARGVAIKEVLGLDGFDEDDLYETLDWLQEKQDEIEDALFLKRPKECNLFLYDVTSAYLEGDKNELGAYGYNRDKKKGKKQIVIGLLTDRSGYPISVQVFEGSTSDPSTLFEQIDKVKTRFGVPYVTFVGDKGLIKKAQQERLNLGEYFYITSISKPEIQSLIKQGTLQLGLFDSNIAEVEKDGMRYILRRNPIRADEIGENRRQRLKEALDLLDKEAAYLITSTRRDPNKALRRAIVSIEKLNLSRFITISVSNRELIYNIDEEALKKVESLDGCYVIKTDVPKDNLSAKDVHDRYRDLAYVEQAFRTMKTNLLEVRPIYHRKASRTRAHVFVTMLAYAITHELKRLTKPLGFTTDLVISLLNRIQISEVRLGKFSTKKVAIPDAEQEKVLSALGIKLPSNPNTLPKLTRIG